MMIAPRAQNSREGKQVDKPDHLSFFLQCNGKDDSMGWSCQAQAELTAIN